MVHKLSAEMMAKSEPTRVLVTNHEEAKVKLEPRSNESSSMAQRSVEIYFMVSIVLMIAFLDQYSDKAAKFYVL